MNPDPDATELYVDSVRVAGRRPRLSALIVGLAIVSFVGLAIVKPWVPPPDSRAAEPSPLALIAGLSPGPTKTLLPTVAEATPLPFVPTAIDLLGATSRRESWGIREVVVPSVTKRFDVDRPELTERWISIDVAHGAAWNLTGGGAVENSGDAVLAIGATMPPGVKPLSVRFWRLDDAAAVREIAPRPLDNADPAVRLWLPDPTEATAIGTWSPGTYRINVTAGERVVHLVMVVRDDLSTG